MADRPFDVDVNAQVRSFATPASSSVCGPGGVINPAGSRSPPLATNDARGIGGNDAVGEPRADTNG